ncbi:hypothetical protein [Hymenobacter perfusus]|uniref:Two pore domain potassium channel family protein n=1 Tax=Hymenobacter perfusus TaxID=1236770 RepID=A0A3R9MCV9_9BACT|nr:hypothetical protein [Hymenobacter perfusus]RSK42865.1 hypothetical protein EI293_13785 [Hymenobacter perfusus]
MLDLLFRALAFVAGVYLVADTVLAAIRSFVLPRSDSAWLNTAVFRLVRWVFETAARLGRSYEQRDRILALYAPVGLVMLPIAWLTMVSTGYTAIFWGLGEGDLERCFRISNSSLLTLGSEDPSHHLVSTAMSYSEATLGLLLLTLLISYLPTMYQAFSRRELTVARLELRAGIKASAVQLLLWLNQSGSLNDTSQWQAWEEWFVEIEETHTSLPIMAFFRSPQPGRSWITAADIILDAAALISSTVDQPRNAHRELCFKAGCVSLNRVSRYFKYDAGAEESAGKAPDAPHRHDFTLACQQLRAAGIPLQDENMAWEHYVELRSRYAGAIAYLARLVMAPAIKPI